MQTLQYFGTYDIVPTLSRVESGTHDRDIVPTVYHNKEGSRDDQCTTLDDLTSV